MRRIQDIVSLFGSKQWSLLSICRFLFVSMILLTGCSVTRHLPEGEVLYTGLKKQTVLNSDKSPEAKAALIEIEAALACAPNNALFGSSRKRLPFPIGLWIYNRFERYTSGPGRWIFNHMAAHPVLISTVNPELRVKVVNNILRENGFFNGFASFQQHPDSNTRKASLSYTITMNKAYRYDSIEYRSISPAADSIIALKYRSDSARKVSLFSRLRRRSSSGADSALSLAEEIPLLKKGDVFNAGKMEAERQRLTTLLKNHGFYYAKSQDLIFEADTLLTPGAVHLRIVPTPSLSLLQCHPWYIGTVSLVLSDYQTSAISDTIQYKGISIAYNKPLQVRPSVLNRQLRLLHGEEYTLRKNSRTLSALSRLGIFSSSEIQFTPRSDTLWCDTLDMRVLSTVDLPLDGKIELNLTSKSNDQVGPGALFSLSKRNVFRGGESFSFTLRGSYEWQTGNWAGQGRSAINSYEIGSAISLTFPQILFPYQYNKKRNYQASTIVKLYGNRLSRAGYFQLFSFGGSTTYDFKTTRLSKHTLVPFDLSYNYLSYVSNQFDSIMTANPALALSFKNQFVPKMGYTYTYDNSSTRRVGNTFWWQTSASTAGVILSSLYMLKGEPFNSQKELFNIPYAQFLKLTSEVRYNLRIDENQSIAMRLGAGVIYAYGKDGVAPFAEQFYVGGANSIRAFTIRSIGPGGTVPNTANRYSYLDQTGDIKLEANVEYRFSLVGSLKGALFVDAGNNWLLKNDPDRPLGQLKLNSFPEQIALGTGCGVRYDLTFLILRFDMGVALHLPYETTRSGYYNVPNFKDGLGFHLAIGYPF